MIMTHDEVLEEMERNLRVLLDDFAVPILQNPEISEKVKKGICLSIYGLSLHIQSVAQAIVAVCDHQDVLDATN